MEDSPGRWKFHPHSADAKFEAHGKTREEMFRNAGIACFEIITDTSKIKPTKEFPIKIKAKKLESLLFDYLDELLFLLDTEGLIVNDVDGIEIKDGDSEDGKFVLEGVVHGDYHKAYDVSCNVKAITYNDMHIKTPEETGKDWECMVVVDL